MYSGSEGEDEVDEAVGGAEGGLEQEGEEEAPSRNVPKHLLSPKTASSEYVSCASELEVSAHPGSATTHPSAQATPPDSATIHPTAQATHPPENGRTGQLHPPPPPSTAAKFNNLLDSCNADDSDTVKPKPRAPPQPKLATVYQAADDVPRREDDPPSPSITPTSSPGDGSPTKDNYYRRHHGHSPLNGMSPSPLGMFPGGEEQLQSYLFPISNSPMDLVTMLSRLASFTGELLLVLTPKIRKTSFERSKVCYLFTVRVFLSLSEIFFCIEKVSLCDMLACVELKIREVVVMFCAVAVP